MDVNWPRVRRTIMEIARPLARTAGRIHTPPHYRAITKLETYELAKLIEPGDVLLSHRNREVTNLLIPGYWKHCAMYTGEGRIVEAMGRGVVDSSLEEFCMTKDGVLCLRATFASPREAGLTVSFAKSLRGKPYDYLIEHEFSRAINEAFYCSEIPWWCYEQVFIAQGKSSPFEPRETLGVPTIAPQDYRNAHKLWNEVLRLRGEDD